MPADNNSTAVKPGLRLRELGLVLPKAPTPLGACVPPLPRPAHYCF